MEWLLLPVATDSLRNLKGGRGGERIIKTDFFCKCCAQGNKLDGDSEKKCECVETKKKKKNKTKNAKFLHRLAYLMNN